MDIAVDLYGRNENSRRGRVLPTSFIYDDNRYYSKLYVFLKVIGIVTYTATLTRCNSADFYIIMIVVMFLSAMNSVRYEYKHFKRHGTTFPSIDEYRVWKKELWPMSRLVFSMIELVIKLWFFIKTYPPLFEVNNLCNMGEAIFTIHVMTISMIYIFVGCVVTFFFLLTSCNYYLERIVNTQPVNTQVRTISLSALPALPALPALIMVNDKQNEECCICLDNSKNQTWSALPCGHKFHGSCISAWLLQQQKCPVCRHVMTNMS